MNKDELKKAGFSDREIDQYITEQSPALKTAGFSEPEISEYFGLTSKPEEEGIWEGAIKPTLKAIPRVVGAGISGLATMPVSGLAGLAQLARGKSLEESQKTMEEISGYIPEKLITTPEEAQGLENLMLPMKVFEYAGKGGQAVGRATGIPYAEPVLGTAAEAGAMFLAPGVPKAVKSGLRLKTEMGKMGKVMESVPEVRTKAGIPFPESRGPAPEEYIPPHLRTKALPESTQPQFTHRPTEESLRLMGERAAPQLDTGRPEGTPSPGLAGYPKRPYEPSPKIIGQENVRAQKIEEAMSKPGFLRTSEDRLALREPELEGQLSRMRAEEAEVVQEPTITQGTAFRGKEANPERLDTLKKELFPEEEKPLPAPQPVTEPTSATPPQPPVEAPLKPEIVAPELKSEVPKAKEVKPPEVEGLSLGGKEIDWEARKVRDYEEGRISRIDTSDEYRLSNIPKDGTEWGVYKKANPQLQNQSKVITIYRATEGADILPGDWIYLRRDLAEKHSKTRPGAKVQSKKVSIDEIITGSDDVEFVYSPRETRVPNPSKSPEPVGGIKEPGTILAWVRAKGGIWDESLTGEVNALHSKESGVVGLVSKKGKTLDELASQAVDDGWLPQGSGARDMLDLLNKDIASSKQQKPRAVKMGKEEGAKEPEYKLTPEEKKESDRQIKLEKEGFVPTPEPIIAGDLKPGDELVIKGEKYKHEGFDKEGNAIIKDGQTFKLDAFEKIDADAVKEIEAGRRGLNPVEIKALGIPNDQVRVLDKMRTEDPANYQKLLSSYGEIAKARAEEVRRGKKNRMTQEGMFGEKKQQGALLTKEPKVRGGRRGEAGKVNMDVLWNLSLPATGAISGAAADDENRWRGAIIGATSGFIISRALLPKLLGKKAVLQPRDISKIEEKGPRIEVKPIEEGPLTEPVLNLGINKQIANVTEELFRSAGMKWDPDIMITDQVTQAMNKVGIPVFKKILGDVGLPVEEFTKHYFRESITKYAKGLGEWGAVVKRLMKDNPDIVPALDKIAHEATGHDAMTLLGSWWRRADGIRRGLLVTQLSTAMRNAVTQQARVGLDVLEKSMESGLQSLFKTKGHTGALDGLESLTRIFRKGNKADVEAILKAQDPSGAPLFGREYDRLFGQYLGDLQSGGPGEYARKAVDVLNSANRFQEFVTRRGIFMAKLDQAMRWKGKNLESIIEKNEIGSIPVEAIKQAVDASLEMTFAKSPQYGTIPQKFISFINSMPGATFVIPFPRFLYNSLKFSYEYSPAGFMKLLSKEERARIANGDMKTITRASLGSAMLGTAYQFRQSEYAGEKWYEAKVGDNTVDLRPYNPFAAYLFVADIMNKAKNGTLYRINTSDIVQGLLSTNLRAGTGLYAVDKVLDGFSAEGKFQKSADVLKGFGGQVIGGLATPITQVRDFLNGFDDYIQKETRQEPLTGQLKSRIPGIESGMEPRYVPTRGEPAKSRAPALRQLTGIAASPGKNILEKELDRFGFERREVIPSVGNPKADNLLAKKMGELSEDILVPMLNEQYYKDMTDAEKEYYLSSLVGRVRKQARKEAAFESPDLFEEIAEEKIPRRKARMLREYGIGK